MYHTQGAVPLKSGAHVTRDFEQAVFREILANRWVLLLGPRQHGKSTGLIRINHQLTEAGLLAVRVDLQSLPPCGTYIDLLRWFSNEIAKRIGVPCPYLPNDGDGESLLSWLQTIIPDEKNPVVIIVDEAASIESIVFRNSFYGQIREISSLRAEASDGLPSRLRFIFSGTFRPETLVQEKNSPFNVCEIIHTDDLSVAKANELVQTISPEFLVFADRAYGLVGGQPFLIQTIFKLLSDCVNNTEEESFNLICRDLQFSVPTHLESIFSKIITCQTLVEKVSSMVSNGHIALIPADSDCFFLQVLGLAKRDAGTLVFRNKIYAEVARNSTQLWSTPQPAARAPIFRLENTSLAFMRNAALREIAFASFDGGVNAHNNGNYRLALTGFGSAMEAVLMDWLKGLQPNALATAVALARADADNTKRPNFNRFEIVTDPISWRLVNLINVARKVRVATGAPEPSHALREWRNLVHPVVAMTAAFLNEAALEPESNVAAGMFMVLIRDITHAIANP